MSYARNRRWIASACACVLTCTTQALAQAPTSAAPAAAGTTLAVVRARGVLSCGVSQGLAGFAMPDAQGVYRGLDVDVCRAVAAATLGDDTKVRYVPVTGLTRFTALQSGEIDLLTMEVTWTLARDAGQAVDFPVINFIDGQSFMVKAASGVKSVADLDGATICTNPGSASELNLADYFRQHGMKFTPVIIERGNDVIAAYASGRCDAVTSDRSILAVWRRTLLRDPENHVLLPEVVSKEPYSPVVRHGDNQWADIVRWSVWAMMEAEEQGVTSSNAEEMRKSSNPTIQRLLGSAGDFGPLLGLRQNWSYDIIRRIGNYAESYDRNLAPLGLERGVNRSWKQGGLLYSPPFR